MNEQIVVEKKRSHPSLPPRGERAAKKRPRYAVAEKLRAVRLHLEEGFSYELVAAELNVSKTSLQRWVEQYQLAGEAGVQPAAQTKPRPKLPPAIREQIIALKQEHPSFGIQRISQWLRRWFLLPASPETVRRHLHDAELMVEAPPPKKRNLTRPRFFERATPNQMWQSDIFTFRLGGRYAYLIAFLDDYSRFVVGADLYRSPTAAAAIEVYRVAVGEYQPPKEMLTDNGRQYTSWRGTSRFEAELKKDRVAHFKSRPHHPMTLGKIVVHDLAGLPGPRPVRFLRVRPRADQTLDQILQPQAPASGHRRPVSRRPVLRDPVATAPDARGRHAGKPLGTRPSWQTPSALLHGRADGRPVGRAPRREG